MLKRILAVWLPVFFLQNGFAQTAHSDPVRILFVGNSLTYVNDLPALIAELARQDKTIVIYNSFLFPDYSLEDHWKEGKVQAEIEKGSYDFVVAQQGPSALPGSQVLLPDYTNKFAELCNKNNSKLALYMVWPSRARSFDLDNVIKAYTNAAEKSSSLLCRAGLAWKYAWQADSTLPLYTSDNFHPSVTGSVLAALTIYGVLFNKKDLDFLKPVTYSWKNEIPKERLATLKQAALKAMRK
ncbi:MAG: hypothetical protein JNN00_12295 [Chitinophagaceae bacterium]|nr:hypothetical protein [Chitinophagaceae bacterium]